MSKTVKHNEFKRAIDKLWDKTKNTFIKNWGDLEHTLYAEKQNLFDKDTQTVEDTRYTVVTGGGGRIETDPTCRITKISCKAGDEFTVVKGATHDSQQVGIFNSQNQHIQHLNVPRRVVNGKQTYLITIPTNLIDVAYVAVNMYKAQVNPDEVMVFEGNLADNEIPKKYCPFTNGYTAIIDSKKVAMSFDPTGSNLTSITTHDAIKELNGKIANAGGGTVKSVNNQQPDPQTGDVTININDIPNLQTTLASKVDMSLVGNEANKIPVIDGSGKLESSIMPDLAITDVHIVANEQEMMRLTVQKGDVVVVENGPQHQNQTFMCKNDTATAQNDKFIAINMGYPVVKKVNGLLPSNVGELTINASQIDATIENNTKTVERHLTDIGQNLRNTHSLATGYNPRINKLEGRRATTRIGEVIKVWTTNSNDYSDEGCTFIYLGRNNTISANDYPDLASAWGISAGTRFTLPRMNDATIRYDNSTKSVPEKYFLCVKKS